MKGENVKISVEHKLQRALARLARIKHEHERRRAVLSRYRLRRCYVTADHYVKVMVERRLDNGRRLWRLHAQIEGLTETELRAFSRATGITLLDSGRKPAQDIAPAPQPRKLLTSSEPPRGTPSHIRFLTQLNTVYHSTKGQLHSSALAALSMLTDPQRLEAKKRAGVMEGTLAEYNTTVLRRVIACALAVAKEAEPQ